MLNNNYRKNNTKKYKEILILFFIASLFLVTIFYLKYILVCAKNSSYNNNYNIKKYESVLILEGDTLTSLSEMYNKFDENKISQKSYIEQVIRINNLDKSGHIYAGGYLLLPVK